MHTPSNTAAAEATHRAFQGIRPPRRRRRAARLLLVACAASAMTVVHSPTAGATFPSRNGAIAFRRFLNDEQTWGAVFTIDPDGTDERQISHPPQGYVDRNPDVSPDGRRIAFEREGVDCGPDCGYDEIFVVDVDGSNVTQLTHNPPGAVCGTGGYCNGMPAWSPDGKTIAFSRASGLIVDDLIENVGIEVMNADGSHLRQLTQTTRPASGEDTNPQWSPDGRKIVFQRNNVRDAQPADGIALWTVELRTRRDQRVTPWDCAPATLPIGRPTASRSCSTTTWTRRLAFRPTCTRSGPTAHICTS